jgi:hypothetical protein
MTLERATATEDDLQRFVSTTQNRLAALLKSLNHVKEATQAATRETIALADEPRVSAATEREAEQSELKSTTEHSPAQAHTTNASRVSENRLRETAVDDGSEAENRLAAIKRRLAEQIKNP